MNIRGFLPSSFNEWEGRVAAVIFTGGCNWACPYCHGARLVNDFSSLPKIETEQIFSVLNTRREWVDGVVITGGEPTLQPDLPDFLRELHAQNFAVKLSTNGTNPTMLATLLAEKDLLTCLSFDYKAPLDERLIALAERDDVAAVKESYELARSAPEVEFHTTLCPQFVNRETLTAMAEQLNFPAALWILQQYENDVEMLNAARAGLARYSHAELDDLAAIARRRHPRVLLRYGK